MDREKLVILAAVNGGAQQDRDGARVPISPAEIAEDAYECYKAGASVVHVHARAPDKGPTTDLAVFSEIIKRIRDKCDILIQTTNGFGFVSIKGRASISGPRMRRGSPCTLSNPIRISFRSRPARGISITRRADTRAPFRTSIPRSFCRRPSRRS